MSDKRNRSFRFTAYAIDCFDLLARPESTAGGCTGKSTSNGCLAHADRGVCHCSCENARESFASPHVEFTKRDQSTQSQDKDEK